MTLKIPNNSISGRIMRFFKFYVTFLLKIRFGWNFQEINDGYRGAFSQSFSPKDQLQPLELLSKKPPLRKIDPVRVVKLIELKNYTVVMSSSYLLHKQLLFDV